MTSVIKTVSEHKNQVSVAPVQWLPGSLSAALPLFSVQSVQSGTSNTLYFRADDPNIYGIGTGFGTISQNPQIIKLPASSKYPGGIIPANKGCNFYSAPWCIPTFASRDTGKRIPITALDTSIYTYITALYGLVGTTPITLTNWKFEQSGYVKVYQILQGSRFTIQNGISYFGGIPQLNTVVAGVGTTTPINSPIITSDFTFSSDVAVLPTYQMPYNTFCAIDEPIVISAVDSSNPENKRVYFTLHNNVTLYNSPQN